MDPSENLELARAERRAGNVVVRNTPTLLSIETTSICNLRCVMCSQAIGAVDRPKHLPVAMIDSLSGALGAAHTVQLHGIGEPLTSPSFWRALEGNHFHEDCDVQFNTNLTILDDKRIARIKRFNGKLLINVSLDAATEQTYRRIRGYDFSIVLNNLRRLFSARGDRRRPIVYMNMTLMRENIEEIVQFVELAKELGANGVLFGHLNRLSGEEMSRFTTTQEDGWRFD